MQSKSLEVQDYEHNLKIHYESKRKELEILLTSSMPNQLSNIKTLLWFNVASLALLFKYFTVIDTSQKGYLILVSVSILILLFAMLVSRQKDYGSPEDVLLASTYQSGKWTQSRFILDMLATVQHSIEFNRTMVMQRAKMMNIATFMTFFSTIYLVLMIFNISNLTKGG